MNKHQVKMFPFNFLPMGKIAEKHHVDYNSQD